MTFFRQIPIFAEPHILVFIPAYWSTWLSAKERFFHRLKERGNESRGLSPLPKFNASQKPVWLPFIIGCLVDSYNCLLLAEQCTWTTSFVHYHIKLPTVH